MELYIPKKVPLTEEDVKWCRGMLEKAEPYSDEEANILDRPLDFDREMATIAKHRLERGYI